MALEITEALLRALSPNEVALNDARGLLARGAFRGQRISPDGVFVMADCHGSGKSPYRVAIDLGAGERPLCWCNCQSRSSPCKHSLGLMLGFAHNPEGFAQVELPQELLDKRAKHQARPSRIGELKSDPTGKATEQSPSGLAARRKTEEQRVALETLERFVVDIVSQGLGGAHSRTLKAIEAQASRMGDADLTGLKGLLVRLSAALHAQSAPSDDDGGNGSTAAALYAQMAPEARNSVTIGLLAQLWVIVRKARAALAATDTKEPSGDGALSGAPSGALETLLGRKWQLPQLKAAGHWTHDLRLMELAHERVDDVVGENILTTGWLLNMANGDVLMERTIIPYKALHAADVKHRNPRAGVLSVREAALYPAEGMNRRVRWADRDASLCVERAVTPEDRAVLHSLARPVESVMTRWREILKNPMADRECVALLGARGFEARGGSVVMFDSAGARLTFADPPGAQRPTTPTLAYAAGAQRSGSVAARLWLDPLTHTVRAQALALFAGETHLRLGM